MVIMRTRQLDLARMFLESISVDVIQRVATGDEVEVGAHFGDEITPEQIDDLEAVLDIIGDSINQHQAVFRQAIEIERI